MKSNRILFFFVASLGAVVVWSALVREVSVFQKFPYAFEISENISPLRRHEIVFAISQKSVTLLDRMLNEVSFPESATFGNFKSRKEVAELTSNEEATLKVLEFLDANGVVYVRRTMYGEYIRAVAPVVVWEQIFQTKFIVVTSANDHSKSTLRTLQYYLPKELEGHVLTVFNTVQTPVFGNAQRATVLASGGPIPADLIKTMKITSEVKTEMNSKHVKISTLRSSSSITPSQNGHQRARDNSQNSRKASPSAMIIGYTYPQLLNSLYNIDNNIGYYAASQGVFETAGQTLSKHDMVLFDSTFNIPFTMPALSVGGHISDLCSSVPTCGEANLDVQYLMGLAQNVPTTYWYTDDTSSASFTNWLVDVADDPAPPLVFSISYSISEHFLTQYEVLIFDIEAKKLGLQGVTLLSASGDAGVAGDGVDISSCGYNPVFPASSPYVTAVGGTQGPERGTIETACQSSVGSSAITTGGGFSNVYRMPEWQSRAVNGYLHNIQASPPYVNSSRKDSHQFPFPSYNRRGRAYPDVSLLAVKYVVAVNGSFYPADGTSASCPVVAAMVSLINSARLAVGKPPLGWLNPTIYATNGSFARDITIGENNCLRGDQSRPSEQLCCRHGFRATAGWDPLTGFGSVDYRKFHNLFFSSISPVQRPQKVVYQAWLQLLLDIIRNPHTVLLVSMGLLFFLCFCYVGVGYFRDNNHEDNSAPATPGQYGSMHTVERAPEYAPPTTPYTLLNLQPDAPSAVVSNEGTRYDHAVVTWPQQEVYEKVADSSTPRTYLL